MTKDLSLAKELLDFQCFKDPSISAFIETFLKECPIFVETVVERCRALSIISFIGIIVNVGLYIYYRKQKKEYMIKHNAKK